MENKRRRSRPDTSSKAGSSRNSRGTAVVIGGGSSMIVLCLWVLTLAVSYVEVSEAFLTSSGASTRSNPSLGRGILQSTAAPLRQEAVPSSAAASSSSSSSASSSSSSASFQSLNEFNAHLEKIAEHCGSFHEPVIARAAECQQLWEEEQDREDGRFQPDLISLRAVLTAWSRCTQTLAKSRRDHKTLPAPDTNSDTIIDVYTPLDAAKRGTSLLLAYPNPDLLCYNVVLDAWSKSRVPEAPDAAERLLKRMMEDEDVEPDTVTYNLLLDTWANSNKENSLDKVMQIYKHMNSIHEAGNKSVTPSIRTINAILHAHAKKASQYTKRGDPSGVEEARKCADDAYEILKDAKRRYEETKDPDWQPDVASYTSCIDVYARVATYSAAKRAEDLLHEVKDLHTATKSYKYKLNYRTYTTVISAWSRTKSDQSPTRVEALLKEMAQDNATKPNARTYTAAVQCWARSRDPLKAKRVLKLLMDMREEYKETGKEDVLPTTITYNNAIDACARCQGTEQQKTEAMKIAFAIFKTIEMDEFASPDAGTYSTLLRAVTFLMPAGKERNKVSLAVFEKAKKSGLVEFNAVRNLRRCVDAEAMKTALEGKAERNGSFDYNNLPPGWSRNVN